MGKRVVGTGSESSGDPRALSLVAALELLGYASAGRLIYIRHALPTLHPAGHLLEGGDLIVFLAATASLGPQRQVVSYQADPLDPATGLRWCVLVTGISNEITDPAEQRHYRTVMPLVAGARPRLLRIHPELAERIADLDGVNER
ncbi:pyridoxamine 5'-phosphate oxidase family protein [Nocardia terpenica]|uniref:pyridoxamine 5'-phosphate oxidase family protein n=1 Tax=Nocardia terpenica TaxID=455432 RepID=UPI002FDFBC25